MTAAYCIIWAAKWSLNPEAIIVEPLVYLAYSGVAALLVSALRESANLRFDVADATIMIAAQGLAQAEAKEWAESRARGAPF